MLVASAWESTLKVKVMLVPVVSCMSGVVFELILPAPVSETVRVFTPPVTFALGNVHVAPLRLGSPSVTEGGVSAKTAAGATASSVAAASTKPQAAFLTLQAFISTIPDIRKRYVIAPRVA